MRHPEAHEREEGLPGVVDLRPPGVAGEDVHEGVHEGVAQELHLQKEHDYYESTTHSTFYNILHSSPG